MFLINAAWKLVLSIVLAYLLSYPAMILWNECLLTAAPMLHVVTWHQMWGIMVMLYVVTALI